MNRVLSLVFAVLVAVAFCVAQEKAETTPPKATKDTVTMKGYVVDQMCAKGFLKKDNFMQKAAAHSQDCALEDDCAATGYGMFSDGKWYSFDEGGSKQAKALIEKSKRSKGLYFEVSGKLDGQTVTVASLKEATPETTPSAK